MVVASRACRVWISASCSVLERGQWVGDALGRVKMMGVRDLPSSSRSSGSESEGSSEGYLNALRMRVVAMMWEGRGFCSDVGIRWPRSSSSTLDVQSLPARGSLVPFCGCVVACPQSDGWVEA